MTVKELKERLNDFPDDCIVVLPYHEYPWMIEVANVSRGCNEADNCVFLDDYEDE
jgi:hypothetical protein